MEHGGPEQKPHPPTCLLEDQKWENNFVLIGLMATKRKIISETRSKRPLFVHNWHELPYGGSILETRLD